MRIDFKFMNDNINTSDIGIHLNCMIFSININSETADDNQYL